MVRISFENVVAHFTHLSGCDVDEVNTYISLIENAWRRISALLDENKASAGCIASAEYAAGTYAFYDYICTQHARKRSYARFRERHRLMLTTRSRQEAARALRDSALEVIKPFMLGCDFLFKELTADG